MLSDHLLINAKANQVFEKFWKMQDNYGNLPCTVISIGWVFWLIPAPDIMFSCFAESIGLRGQNSTDY